jgi:hypothetical protein
VGTVVDAKHSEHLYWSRIHEDGKQVKELVFKSRGMISHEAADMLGISFGPVRNILNDNVNMPQIPTKFLPHTE